MPAKGCKVCKIVPVLLGKAIFLPLLKRTGGYIQCVDIEPLLQDLSLELVGGLVTRGYTTHDIDIIGDKRDIPVFVDRLRQASIPNPIHYCGKKERHSHWQCVYYGLKLAVTGRGY